MADFTTADLEGANELLNKTLTDALALKDQLVASHGADATALLNSLQSKITDLQSSLLNMIPELPTVPNVNMQSEFATLVNFDVSTPQGIEQYTTQVANITSQFGTAMADKGLDIDSLASQIQTGGKDLVGDLLPNLQLPDGETLPIELPANISLPSVESVTETISKTSKDGVSLVTEEIKVSVEESPGYTKVTKTVATTTTTNPKTVTNTTTKEKLRVSDTGGETKSWRSSQTQEERDKKYTLDSFKEFGKKINNVVSDLKQLLIKEKSLGKKIWGYGAPVKGNTLLNYMKVDSNLIEKIVEVNPYKIGTYAPGSHIPVIKETKTNFPDCYLLLSHNFEKEILEKNKEIINKGTKFIIPFSQTKP